MTKRKPRSRAKPRAAPKSSSARNWLLAGAALAAGWFAFDANRPFVETQLAAVRSGLMPVREASAPARPAPAGTAATPAQPARQLASAGTEKPRPRAGDPALRAAAEPALPTRRPPAAAAAGTAGPSPRVAAVPAARGAQRIARQTPLYRDAARTAPVWVVLEAGHTVRVTGRKDEFRRVEAGIFTGWVEATSLDAAPAPAATAPKPAQAPAPAPMRAASVSMSMPHTAGPAKVAPMPRGAIPENRR